MSHAVSDDPLSQDTSLFTSKCVRLSVIVVSAVDLGKNRVLTDTLPPSDLTVFCDFVGLFTADFFPVDMRNIRTQDRINGA